MIKRIIERGKIKMRGRWGKSKEQLCFLNSALAGA
jgi:hypothetical protein